MAAVDLSGLVNYGPLGLFAILGTAALRVMWFRETKRTDRLEAEKQQLYADKDRLQEEKQKIQTDTIAALVAATRPLDRIAEELIPMVREMQVDREVRRRAPT